jgi:hypothetical protein
VRQIRSAKLSAVRALGVQLDLHCSGRRHLAGQLHGDVVPAVPFADDLIVMNGRLRAAAAGGLVVGLGP